MQVWQAVRDLIGVDQYRDALIFPIDMAGGVGKGRNDESGNLRWPHVVKL